VCQNASPLQLTAFPDGGVWRGNGVTSATEGVFHPSLAGAGIHKIRYSVDDCDAPNTLLIKVDGIPKTISLLEHDSVYFCGNTTKSLEVQRNNELAFSWSYSEEGESYIPFAADLSTIEANKPGYYKVIASNVCATIADTVWVGNLFPYGGSDFEVCISAGITQLSGNDSSGSWLGSGTSPSGSFDPARAGAGRHELQFVLTPAVGCTYSDTVVVDVYALPDAAIRSAGVESFCYTGKATLSVPAMPNAGYTWYFGSDPSVLSIIGENNPELVAEASGFYRIVASNGQCSSETSYQLIPDAFLPKITPAFDSISFCGDQPLTISAESIPNSRYSWFEYVDGVTETPHESTGSFLEVIRESGKFKLRVESHGCVFESNEMAVWKIPSDSVFVPNVITPNGDAWNEDFEIYSEGVDDFSVKVFGRYGQEVWSGSRGSRPWRATDVSAGVYFWVLSYRSPCSNHKEQKGWVHVLKE
jgi:hypothetical protein